MRARAGAPQVPPQRDDLLDGVRVQRELRPADLARRGGARQAVAGVEDARRLVAAARQPPRVPGLHVGPPRQATPLHGPGVRPGRGVVGGHGPDWWLLDPAYGAEADHRGVRDLVRDLNARLPAHARAVAAGHRPRRASAWVDGGRRRGQRYLFLIKTFFHK